MKTKNQNISIKSFLDKLDRYREDNIILLEILNTAEEYIGECFREDKIEEKNFFKNLNTINSCKQRLQTIEETYINHLLIKKKQNQTLKKTIKILINSLNNKRDSNNCNVYDRFKEYVDFTQDNYLSEAIY